MSFLRLHDILKTIFILIIFLIFISIFIFGWTETWKFLFVPTVLPTFGDMRAVQAAVDSVSQGHNPQIYNPGDYRGTLMNYPMIWMLIAKILNFKNETNYLIFMITSVFLYLTCCYMILKKGYSFWTLIFIFSGSSLLAIERGNNDIILFVLLYYAANMSLLFSSLLFILSVNLKIYPLVTAPLFIRNKKSFFIISMLIITSFFYLSPQLNTIFAATPASYSLSYGSLSISIAFKKFLNIHIAHIYISAMLIIISIILGCFARRYLLSITRAYEAKNTKLFLIGSFIYLSTFAITSNWDYRLIFLILCVPFILHNVDTIIKKILLVNILLAMNLIPLNHLFGKFGSFLNIVSKSMIFVIFIVILIDIALNKLNLKNIKFKNKFL